MTSRHDFRRLAFIAFIFLLCAALLAGCSSGPRKGGYYQNDGPGKNPPSDLHAIPDAVPVIEPFARANLRPYRVFGRQYVPVTQSVSFRQEGTASWYGRQFHGNRTANGETYDMYAMSAAHPTLPLPSYARVTRKATGKSVIVRINDRGPFHSGRIIDLSYAAASKLGLIGPGSGTVVVEAITHEQIRAGLFGGPTQVAAAQATATEAATPMPISLSEITAPTQAQQAAAPTMQQTAATSPPTGGASRIFLQFGAFGAPENAHGLANRLTQQISATESQTVLVQPAGAVHRVLMGPYNSRTEAVNAANRIQQQTGVQPGIALL
ncbi:septal ring lytic transglycosylase RlpA family protein [Paracandidimonas soli]|uniref:septal ring lytic transglycosylase RlpA family protein n=1 Tax=Paracandidimonas soli TaxID=1917182 RepID=UPI00333E4D8C